MGEKNTEIPKRAPLDTVVTGSSGQTDTNLRVLIVDDDQVSRSLLKKAIGDAGFRPLTACSVREGIHCLQADSTIALIFLDIMMPDEDGYTLLEYLNANLRFRHIPVIMCSSLGDSQSVARSLRLGARDYITKPFDAKTVIRKAKTAISQARKTVLHVVSDPQLSGILARAVRREGFISLSAASPSEALSTMENTRVDLMITDIDLPEKSGWELLTDAKDKQANLPVLVIVEQGKSQQVDPMTAGADGTISKPFHSLTIGHALREAFMRNIHESRHPVSSRPTAARG